ncbi:MAG TPA: HAD family hydrolase [Clostridia bacterium]|nr:HAD family hydrolase [Clostridia bacterium]
MSEKNVILFDLDGTLTDPAIGITKSVAYALEAFGIHTDDLNKLCKFIGPPLRDSLMEYYGFSEEQALAGIEKYREYFAKTGIYENRLYPGIKDMLEKLKAKGMKVILATSKQKVFADIILEHFGIMQYFDLVCGCELDGTRGRKGEVIRYALETADVKEPDNAVMVGDRKHDVLGAKEAGIACVGVLFGYGGREELHEAGADTIVETVEELSEVLLGGFKG